MQIVTRDQWGSKSKFKYGDMKLPALNVFLHHTVTTVTDYPYKDARLVESIGIARFGQMSYSFLVHPDGTVLEGAGTKTGAHTEGRNSTSFGIAMIGDYTKLTPTQAQISSFRELVHYLKVTKNWLVDSAIVTPHRAVSQTACPGNNIMLVLDQFREPWVPPAPVEVRPMFDPPLNLEPIAAELEHNGGTYLLASSGALYAFSGAIPIRGANGQPYFQGRTAARIYKSGDPLTPAYTVTVPEGVVIQTTTNEWYGLAP